MDEMARENQGADVADACVVISIILHGNWKMDVRGYSEFHYVGWCHHPEGRRTVYEGLVTCRDCGRPFDLAGEPFVSPQRRFYGANYELSP